MVNSLSVILIAVGVLGAIGLISALILFLVSKKFAVKEDPRIGEVQALLPGANCGGCGFAGCAALAAACVKAADAGSAEIPSCPGNSQESKEKIAAILGVAAAESVPKVAVVRCNGSCENRPKVVLYDGVKNCKIANTTCRGESLCQYGCLGCGDCVSVCKFDAIKMNAETGLPEVDREKCTSCGACAKACPRNIIEIRQVDKDKTGMVVECMNKDKGAQAQKACSVACIGCSKCVQACGSEAITLENNLAYIDAAKCTSCRACEEACPKACIRMIGEPHKVIQKKPAAAPKAETGTEAPKPANTNTRPYDKPIEVSFDAPLLPSQQYMLAGTVDLVPPTANNDKAEEVEHSYDAPLLPSQQILLGLKNKKA